MKIIVDTNILFSAILNTESTIGRILITLSEKHELFSPSYAVEELQFHKKKIINLGRYTEHEFDILFQKIIACLDVIDAILSTK